MKIVDVFRRVPPDGEIEWMARVSADGDQSAQFHFPVPEYEEGLIDMLSEPIPDSTGRPVTPSDGEAYVAALPEVYRGSRFWAKEVDSQGPTPETMTGDD